MLGTKIYKPTHEDENGNVIIDELVDWTEYSALADWCNHNRARIVDNGDCYECVPCRERTTEQTVEILRRRRERECFPIINRGKLWYDSLTIAQLRDLQTWYQAWLDVTETMQVPETPAWIINP